MAYSPPEYPAAIPDQITDLPDQTDDIDWIEAWIYNYVKKELIAVMTELGTDPAGAEATVAARLTAIESAGVDESVIMNIYLNSFRIAILGSYAIMDMAKGISDEYEDETGIDTTTSTHEDYDSANDLYSPEKSYGSDILTGGTATADSHHNNEAAYAPDKAVDGSTAGGWASMNTAYPHWWKYDLGSGNDKTARQLTIYPAMDSTFARIKNFVLSGSNNDSDWTTLKTDVTVNSETLQTFTFTNTTSYRYYKIAISSVWGGSFPNQPHVKEFQLMEETIDNMTLVSETFVADSAPDDARIIIFEEDVDAITLNTDIKAYVSRDDGANYTQITLTDEGNYSGSKRILSGTADISGQAEDTDMVYKIESLNTKDLKLHGVGLSWA